MRAAAADVFDRVDVGVGRCLRAAQQVGCGHDLTGLAIAALRHVAVQPGHLHRMQAFHRIAGGHGGGGRPFDGGHTLAAHVGHAQRAHPGRLAVDVASAGFAHIDAAAVFGAGDAALVAQHPHRAMSSGASTDTGRPLTLKFWVGMESLLRPGWR